jgi:hypothetical protein
MKEITSSLTVLKSKCFKPSSKLDIPQDNLFSSFLHDEHTDLLVFFEKRTYRFLSFFIPALFTVNKNSYLI